MSVKIKEQSIIKKFMGPILIIMVIQTVLFACILLFSGTIRHLNDNSFDILTERTISRKNDLENEMIQHWSALEPHEDIIVNQIESFLADNNISAQDIDDKASIQILDSVSEQIISLLRDNSVTDAFLIMNGNRDDNVKYGLYLRDSDPTTNSADNSDLLIENAPASITKKLNISLDSTWDSKFTLDPADSTSAFYYNPFNAAQDYPEVGSSDLAYWSPPFDVSADTARPIITYTIPLRLSDGTIIGVLGTGVSTDYISTLLPYNEIDINKNGFCLLGISENGSLDIQNLTTSGPMAKLMVGTSDTTPLAEDNSYENIYQLQKKSKITDTVYTSMQPIHLYNSNTLFEGDQWVLLGAIESKYLLDSSYQVTMMAIISSLISILFGMVAAMIAGRRLTKPIVSLAHTLQSSSAELPLKFAKTHIAEIDRLADAVEILSNDIEESASKLSQIIQAANIAIGAYEYNAVTDQVIITGRFFSQFGLEERTHMSGDEFQKLIKTFSSFKEPHVQENESVYRLIGQNGNSVWLRLKLVGNETTRSMGVLTDITQEMLEKRKLEYERDYDLLTNLLNRRAFQSLIHDLFKKPEQLKTAAFMMWDLDNLKYINDTYGHDYGDEYIKKAANILKQFTSNKNTIVARMSGDEFYVFIYGCHSKDEIRQIMEPIKNKMDTATLYLPDSGSIKIRASAGISWFPSDATDYSELIKYADFAMYTVKNTEKGKIAEFDKSLYSRDSFLLHSKEELNRLIENELVTYAFQPIVDARTGEIFAYEALMRPQSPTLRSPADVLRIAQAQSHLYQIENLTMFKALKSYLNFPDKVHKRKLFINTLPSQMLSGDALSAFERKFHSVLDDVVFEIMETERLDENFTARKLELFKKWNSQIALDDYGTGYSSDSILLLINPDYVKIDMSIIHDIDADPNRQLLFENLSTYLKQKNIKIIAEGVETYAEMKTLISYGIDYLQGYYIGMPENIPIDQTIRMQEIRDLNSN